MYRMNWRHGSTMYDMEHNSKPSTEHYSELPYYTGTCLNYTAEYDPDSASVLPSLTVAMLLPHIMKPYEISLWRSFNV